MHAKRKVWFKTQVIKLYRKHKIRQYRRHTKQKEEKGILQLWHLDNRIKLYMISMTV